LAEHTIDDKGRITIPTNFREQLGLGAYVTLGLDGNLNLMTREDFEQLAEQFNQMSFTDPDVRDLQRLIFSYAVFVEFDKAGRILIPQYLRQEAQIDTTVIISGANKWAEIWSPENWQERRTRFLKTEENRNRYKSYNIPYANQTLRHEPTTIK
jgi:MraZ protein